jgi:hypothetical protein
MPVVDATDTKYLLLEFVEANGTLRTRWIEKSEVIAIHDRFDGGSEVAFLSKLSSPIEEKSHE